uniref:Extracellular sulfatase SULF-1 n=2 Tax=Anthurium amnicola TaxID=1678845 RepID=A0A1D1YHK7_9ARAE
MTTDATEAQVVEAMHKIASHIKNPSKFSKAAKLALHLIQAGSVKADTSDHFFAILEAAMFSPSACTESSLRADYQALFSAAQDVVEHFSKQQKDLLHAWTIRAVVANDLHTDDSFVFSKAAGKIKEAISSLPSASEDDDIDEAAFSGDLQNVVLDTDYQETKNSLPADSTEVNKESSDPFGLDELLSDSSRKGGKARGRKEAAMSKLKVDEEHKRFLRSQREALILCLEIAARRYKIPWAQTVIDILIKHAFDHIEKFTCQQRDAIEKLWTSIREQQIRRKQGKSVSGKLDVTAFERLQEKYAHEKISIRHAVGGRGDHRAEQWLG